MDCASANIIDTQSPSRTKLSFYSKAPFQEVGCLERAGRKGVEVDGEWAGWSSGRDSSARISIALEECLKGLIGLNGCVHGASGYSGGNANATNLTFDTSNEDRCVWRGYRAKIGHLWRDNIF